MIKHQYNPARPRAELMRGRPDEPESWQAIAVYSAEEEHRYRERGWIPAKEFMRRVARASSWSDE